MLLLQPILRQDAIQGKLEERLKRQHQITSEMQRNNDAFKKMLEEHRQAHHSTPLKHIQLLRNHKSFRWRLGPPGSTGPAPQVPSKVSPLRVHFRYSSLSLELKETNEKTSAKKKHMKELFANSSSLLLET
eukprot:Skav233952  [mRNA]  locus=scaffold1382:195947:196445:+ [translate_table: standard]